VAFLLPSKKNFLMIKKIKAWLESDDKNYQEGLVLASQTINNRNLISFLHKKENAHTRGKLVYELTKFIGAEYIPEPEPVAEAVPSLVEVVEAIANTHPIDELNAEMDKFMRSLPESIQLLYNSKRYAYNKRNQISQAMQDLTVDGQEFDQEHLEGLKKEADAYDEEIKAIDSQLEYYHQNGVLPIKHVEGEPVTITADQKKVRLEELKKLIENKQTAVSKMKSKVAKNPNNLSYSTDQAKLEAELASLRFDRDSLKAQTVA
jgi:arsenate reductase-like glutaredoxin family protein